MENWKEAFWLTKFELRHYAKIFLLLVAILIMLLIFIVPTMVDYFENSFLSIDIFFILFFCLISYWVRPKQFQNKDINNGIWGSTYLITLNQLPIKREIIVRHRFL